MYDTISNAACWKITKPVRIGLDLLKTKKPIRLVYKGFSSLKNEGISATFEKTVTYIKSKKNEITSENFSEKRERDSGYFSVYQEISILDIAEPTVKTIAFYLPQFHEIPENNVWWGNGFTEWVNTKKAQPRFTGHYQPRIPHSDIGYYDLSEIDTMKKQAALAKQHKIYGFCFYYYWFSGKRLLEKPVDLLLKHPEIDINFCLCWANENWTKTWDGLEKNILMEQKYTKEDPLNFIKDIKIYINDSRYIRVNGKPVIIVYNPSKIPHAKEVFAAWRQYAQTEGIGDIVIWICRTPGSGIKELGLETIVDKEVEFPPHNMGYSNIVKRDIVTNGHIYDYSKLVDNVLEIREKEKSSYVYRCTMMGWDNSARRKDGYTVFDNYDLQKFYYWNLQNVREAKRKYLPEDRFVFVNAWNEWAEGTYLEPDEKYGYANINALTLAICEKDFSMSFLIDNKKTANCKIAIQMHIYFPETTEELIMYTNHIPYEFDCYVSTDTMEKAIYILKKFKEQSAANKIEVQVMQNRGRDVAPFVIQIQKVIEQYEYFCHIHSKKSKHFENGDEWRIYLLQHLLGNNETVEKIIETFENNSSVGIMYPETYPNVLSWIIWGDNKKIATDLLYKIGCVPEFDEIPEFPAGNMFWARTEAVKQLFNYGFCFEDFPKEDGQLDLTLAHAIERSWYYIAKANGYSKETAHLQ